MVKESRQPLKELVVGSTRPRTRKPTRTPFTDMIAIAAAAPGLLTPVMVPTGGTIVSPDGVLKIPDALYRYEKDG